MKVDTTRSGMYCRTPESMPTHSTTNAAISVERITAFHMEHPRTPRLVDDASFRSLGTTTRAHGGDQVDYPDDKKQ